MDRAYKALIEMEDDIKEAVHIARNLKKGILFNSVSDEQKREMCNKIIKVLER